AARAELADELVLVDRHARARLSTGTEELRDLGDLDARSGRGEEAGATARAGAGRRARRRRRRARLGPARDDRRVVGRRGLRLEHRAVDLDLRLDLGRRSCARRDDGAVRRLAAAADLTGYLSGDLAGDLRRRVTAADRAADHRRLVARRRLVAIAIGIAHRTP